MKAQASSFIKRGTINNYVRGCLVAMLLLACCGLYALNSRIAKVEAQAPAPSMPGRILNNFGNSEGFAIGAYNTDGTNSISLTALKYGSYFRHPSQSKQTGMIAFAGCGDFNTPVPCGSSGSQTRIFVMNGDGTNIRQITSTPDLTAGGDQSDSSPVISPDGTKVAFISGRANYPVDANGQKLGEEVYVVNVDGTNLHQVSAKQTFQIADNGTMASSRAYAVAWSPDSTSVVARCDRKYFRAGSDKDNKEFSAKYESLEGMLRIFSVDSANDGTLVAISVLPYQDIDPYHGANFSRQADRDKAISSYTTDGYPRIGGLYGVVLDWSPTGDTIIASVDTRNVSSGFVSNPVAVYYGVFNPGGGMRGTLSSQALIGGATTGDYNGDGTRELCYLTPGCARISPDGQQLVYGVNYPNSETRIANSDGSNAHTIGNNSTLGGDREAKWWSPGAPIPIPVQLVLKPNPVSVNQNHTAQLLPTLLDAQGNVIARAASYNRFFDSYLSTGVVCDSAHPCTGDRFTPTVNATGVLTGTSSNGSVTLCAENAGLIGCTLVQNYNKPLLTVSATTQETNKSGTSLSGIFTITRGGDTTNKSPVTFTFTLGGTAQRDVDYTLVNVTGNTVTTDQASLNIEVHPINSKSIGDFDYWTSLITSCPSGDAKCIDSKRVTVSAAFFIEQEFQDTGSFVYRFYKGSLGRQPAYAEFVQDRSRVIGGTNLEASKAAFAETWTQRAEFLAKYPAALTADQFVDALLQTVKQTSTVDLTSQRQTFVNQLQAGGTRAQVIRAVVDAKAFQAAEYNRAFVSMQYFGYLRRDPDTGGYNFWLDILNNRVPNNYRSMVCAFITSAEYQLRFSSVVTRTDQVCGSIGQ